MIKALAAVAILGLNFYVYHFFASEPVYPPRTPLTDFPTTLAEWRCPERQEIEDEVLRNLGVTDYLVCNYRESESEPAVNVYVGYHATQIREEGGGSGGGSIHPPAHCLPGSGWDIIGLEQVPLDVKGLPERPARVNRLITAKGEARQLVYYWYQSRGRIIADDWKKILLVTWDRARLGRTDGSLVRLTTPVRQGHEAEAEARIREFAKRLLPRLPDYVPE